MCPSLIPLTVIKSNQPNAQTNSFEKNSDYVLLQTAPPLQLESESDENSKCSCVYIFHVSKEELL